MLSLDVFVFPSVATVLQCLMIIEAFFIAASLRRALMTALRVGGDMQDSSCVALYSSRPDDG